MVNHQSALRVALQSVMGGVMDDVTIDGVIDGSKDGGNGCVVVKRGTSFVRDVASQSSTDSSMEGIGTKHKEKEEETKDDEERSVLIGRSGNVVSVSDGNKGQLGRDERDGNRKKKSVLKMSDDDDDDEGRGYKGGDWCSSPGEMVTGVLLPDGARPEAFGGGGGGSGGGKMKGGEGVGADGDFWGSGGGGGGGGGMGSGKVDLEYAKRFGSSTSFFHLEEEEIDKLKGEGGGRTMAELTVVARGGGGGGGGGGQVVTLESLSWRDSIKRKFGVK
jgi:hypothetical protein